MQNFKEVPVNAVRNYWNNRPCNIRHSTAEIGTREYFDQVETRKYLVEPHIPEFAEFEKWRGKKVLEIGCGIGTDTINFARAGAQVTAVDLSAESLKLAQKRAQIFNLGDRIKFYEANGEELAQTVPVEKYDLVYSFGVIHHSPNPAAIVKQIRDNFVSPGSTLKMMVYNKRSWKVLGILLGYGKGRFWKLEELIARHSEAQTGCPVTYSYTKENINTLIGDGFKIEDARYEHIFPYKIKDYVEYRYKKNWYFRYLPESVFNKMEKRYGWHLCVTAIAR